MSPRSPAFRVLLLASATVIPFSAIAQPAPSPSTQSGTADAIRVLLDQANYWRSKDVPARADEALSRVLSLDPRNVDALALQAQAAADRNNQQQARASLAKLQAVRPDDPRIASIQAALQAGPLDSAAIADARRLSQSGKPDESVAAYRRAFKGNTPPPGLASEYYQAEASTESGWADARDGLAALVRSNPEDLRAQLLFAQVLTYREGTRQEGIDRLAELARQPTISAAARKSWRDALLWSGDDQRSQAQLDTYLKENQSDPQIESRRADLRASVPDEGARARMSGYQALESRQTAQAEKDFASALAFNAQDVEAMIMLAAIRRVQHREADVQTLIAQAKAINPDRAQELIASVGLDKTYPANGANTGNGGGDYGADIRRAYATVTRLTNRGEYAAAEAALRKLMGKSPSPGAYVQLAYLQLRAGQLAEAESSFRRVLASNPRSGPALNGLADTLTREGKTDEAQTIFARLGPNAGRGLEQTRAAQLRTQAQAATNPAEKVRLYREAIDANPSDPWVRLELARVLQSENQLAEARQVMAAVTDGPRPTVDQLRAGIYFADATHDAQTARSLVARLPANAVTPEMRDVQTRAEVAVDLASAKAAGSLPAMERQMISLASQRDPTGARGAAFANELTKYGDKRGAREVIRTALNASQPPLPQQRIAYAQALVAAGYPREAQVLTAGLDSGRLNPLQRSTLADVQDTSAVAEADALNGRGKIADAYDALAPRLAAKPDDPNLNMALARLYQAHHQPRQAVAITEELLKRNPSSLDVRVAAVYSALAASETGRAADLVSQLKEEFPEEPQTWFAAAQVARANGNSGQALADLKAAKTLRAKQLEASGSSDAADVLVPDWLPGRQYAANLSPNVASDASPVPVADASEPVTRDYERYAQYLPPTPLDPDQPALAGQPNGRLGGLPSQASAATGLLAPAPGQATSAPGAATLSGAADPFQIAQGASLQGATANGADQTSLANPFRSNPAPTGDEPSPPGLRGLNQGTAPVQLRPVDPLMADIDKNIDLIAPEVAPQVQGTLSLRGRTGNQGLAELFDLEAPLEASFSPNGYGRLKVTVTPVYLSAGKPSATDTGVFGSNPLQFAQTGANAAVRNQTAAGSALDVSYAYGPVTGDVGTTPLGFLRQNVVGGIQFAPKLTNNLQLRIVGERRAVTDSLLSYAGTKDPATGETWGGVTRNRGHIQLEGSVGQTYYYAGAGGAVLVGEQVKSNTEVEAGAGFSTPVWSNDTQEVRTGLDLVYFGYSKNLGNFTLGNGGYFSPQQFFAALIPVTYRQQLSPDLVYSVGGSVGVQNYRAKSQIVFPSDPVRQAQLDTLAATNAAVITEQAGFHGTGPAGGAHADVDYRVTSNLHIGGRVGFDSTGNFTEGTGLVYARYVFNDPK